MGHRGIRSWGVWAEGAGGIAGPGNRGAGHGGIRSRGVWAEGAGELGGSGRSVARPVAVRALGPGGSRQAAACAQLGWELEPQPERGR